MARAKYYILYKIERNEDGHIKDLRYIQELISYNDITTSIGITKRTVSKMLNNNINGDWNKLKHYNDYTIIKEH